MHPPPPIPPLGRIITNVDISRASTQVEYSHAQIEVTKKPNSLNEFITFGNRSMIFFRNQILSISNAMITPNSPQILGGKQGLVAFVELEPCKTSLKALTTLLWALNNHQGCG